MDVDVFTNFKVTRKVKYAYISDKIDDEYIFSEEEFKQEEILDGSSLLKWITEDINNDLTIQVRTNSDNEIYIQEFNPNNGEGADIWISFERIKEREDDEKLEDYQN